MQQIKARTRRCWGSGWSATRRRVENRQLVDAQTETVEEVLQLLRDQSYSMRDPATITEQLDGLVTSAEETERGVKDMEELLGSEDELLLGGSLTGLESDLALGSLEAATRTGATTPVSPRVEAESLPREPVKETHVSGRFRAVERNRPMPPMPPPLPPTRKKITE